MNMTLLEKTRCMLSNAKLSNGFLAEVVSMSVYLVNRSPATTIDCKTPNEVWSNKTVNYCNLRIFCCLAYYHVSERKLNSRAKKVLRYGDGVKGYGIWSFDSKLTHSRDVAFD